MKKDFYGMIFILILFIIASFSGKLTFYILSTILALISLYELIHIRNKKNSFSLCVEIISYLFLMMITMFNVSGFYQVFEIDYSIIIILSLILLVPLFLFNDKKQYGVIDAFYLIGTTTFIGISFNSLNQIRSINENYITYIFLIAYISDLFDYISNKLIGKNKVLVSIPTKKTKEGIISSLFITTLLGSLYYISFIGIKYNFIFVFILTFVLTILAQFGNFVFAFIKNQYNKTNFSNIVLGKSGILDNMDSTIFVTIGLVLFISRI